MATSSSDLGPKPSIHLWYFLARPKANLLVIPSKYILSFPPSPTPLPYWSQPTSPLPGGNSFLPGFHASTLTCAPNVCSQYSTQSVAGMSSRHKSDLVTLQLSVSLKVKAKVATMVIGPFRACLLFPLWLSPPHVCPSLAFSPSCFSPSCLSLCSSHTAFLWHSLNMPARSYIIVVPSTHTSLPQIPT